MASEGLRVVIDGKEHAIEEWPFEDLEWLEEHLDVCLADTEVDPVEARKLRTMRGMRALVYLAKKQDDPNVSYDSIGKLSLNVFSEANGNGDEPARPTRARKRAAASTTAASGGTS